LEESAFLEQDFYYSFARELEKKRTGQSGKKVVFESGEGGLSGMPGKLLI